MDHKQQSATPCAFSFDLFFSTEKSFPMSKDTQSLQSYAGVLCSMIMLSVVTIFGYLKAVQFLYQADMNLTTFQMDGYYGASDKFTAQDGLAIAFAVIDYNGEGPKVSGLDEMASYIDLTVGFSGWGTDENGKPYGKIEELGYHPCSKAELGLQNDAEDGSQAEQNDVS